MTCQEAQPYLSAFVDGELDVPTMSEMESHIQSCPPCHQTIESLIQLSKAFRSVPRKQVTQALRISIQDSLPKRSLSPKVLSLFGAFTSGVAATLAVAALLTHRAKSSDSILGNEIIGGHVAALMSNHLLDVISTDRHTVKPWFVGKVPISPTPWDLNSDGFPLIGGRLANVAGHPTPVFVYQRRKHFIDVYVIADPSDATWSMSKQGYHVLAWSQQQLEFIAVSDVDATDLIRLRDDYLRNIQ